MGVGVKTSIKGLGVGDVWDKGATLTLLQAIERDIEARPASHKAADGSTFPEYQTPGYGDSALVDLRQTGAMLGSIRIIKTSARGGIIECSLRHRRAVFMNRRFPFMGILGAEAQRALEAAESEHGKRLSERTKLNTRKGSNRGAFMALRGTARTAQGDIGG